MKKRLLSLVLCLVMVFSLLPFGASAEVYLFEGNAIQLDFYRGEQLINTQRVLTSGVDSIYDPGCPLEENEYFMGWTIEGAGTKATIDEVRAYVAENASSLEGKTLKLTADVSPVHYVVYYDESGRVVKTDAVVKAKNGDSWTTEVNFDYIPADVNKEFYGWTTVSGGSTVEYANGAEFEASADTTALYPVCKSGVWVKFDENDTVNGQNIHASYQPPAFIEEGSSINISGDAYKVAAAGYHFDGWYTAASGGSPVTDVSTAQTVYAHWTAQEVSYKVAYWQQNANDDGYSLVTTDVETRTGTAGTPAGYDEAKAYGYYHMNQTKTNEAATTIAGDGTTIRNVYFDRDTYTLTFKDSNQQSTVSYRYKHWYNLSTQSGTSNIGGQITSESTIATLESNKTTYGNYAVSSYRTWWAIIPDTHYAIKVNGVWYEITSNEGDFSALSSITSVNMAAPIKTITAKHGQYIGDNFPITNDGARWDPQNSEVYEYVLVYIDIMPTETTIFNKDSGSGKDTMYMDFYVEALPEETGTTYTFNGKTFVKYREPIMAKYNYFTEAEDFVDLTGFEHFGSNPAFRNGEADPGNNGTLKLYYSRKSFNLTFFTNGGPAIPSSVPSKVLYQREMKTCNPDNYAIGETVEMINNQPMIFQGWYANEYFAGDPFDFNTERMPADDVALYAKWAPVQYRVVLDANGGSFGEDSSIQFKLDDGDKVEVNNPTNGNLQFVGWYTDPACTQRFNLDTQIRSNVLTDKNWTEADEPTVHGKLTLYAKWRHAMDHNTYLTVIYDPDGGTVNGAESYTDPLSYADQAEAVAQPAAVSAVTGESFAYWEVMKPTSATDPTLVPSGVTVKPGEIFNVKMDDALNNTVTLRAHYEASKGTHIVWYGNGGTTANGAETVESADANLNAAIQVKPADTFTREGYEFLGWARLDEAEMKNSDGSWKPYDGNDLWLTWDGEHFTAVNDHGVTVTDPDIAANEVSPFHVLYAVWDKTENYNFVVDFNGKMTIANSATAKKDDTHNNGAFDVADGTATYQLKNEEDTFTNGANLSFSGIDTALINGIPVGAPAGTTASWEQYTVVPANTVYFDDSLAGKSMTVGDGSGFNAAVKANESSPADGQSKTSITFTFTGTGIDVYCTTDDANGWIQATVDGTNKQPYTNTRFQDGEGTTLYNIPVVSFRGLGDGEHTLVITTLTGANYRIDGVRVYNAMQDAAGETAATVNEAYAAANEQNAVFMEVRDYLLAANSFGQNEGEDAFVGAVFTDKQGDAATIADYTKSGPKNEVYLDGGQGVAFTINNWGAYKGTNKVMVSLSVPAGGSATVAASGRTGDDKITVDAKTHMYYEITPDEDGNVYILNTGSSMVSVADLKITGQQEYTVTRGFTLGAPVSAEETGGMLKASPRKLMAYVASFDPEAQVEVPQTQDETDVTTDPTPEPTSTPSVSDLVKQLISSFIESLFRSVGRLFGRP